MKAKRSFSNPILSKICAAISSGVMTVFDKTELIPNKLSVVTSNAFAKAASESIDGLLCPLK